MSEPSGCQPAPSLASSGGQAEATTPRRPEMRAHGNEGRLGRRFLLAAGLIIAVVVPSAAFGCSQVQRNVIRMRPPDRGWGSSARMGRTNRSRPWSSGASESTARRAGRRKSRRSGRTHHRQRFRRDIAIDAAVRHRRWHFNDLVLDAVGHISNERIDASINFRASSGSTTRTRPMAPWRSRWRPAGRICTRSARRRSLPSSRSPAASGRRRWVSGPEDCHGVQDFHLHRYVYPAPR